MPADAVFPVALLPVRLETRFVESPSELRIRIYPDQLHADGLRRSLRRDEVTLGTRFWTDVFNTGGVGDRQLEAFRTVAAALGIRRAVWVIKALTPRNLDKLSASSGRGTSSSSLKPELPSVRVTDTQSPPTPELLPDRWLAFGYSGERIVFREQSAAVRSNLSLGPDPGADLTPTADGKLSLDSRYRWMVDFEEAVRAGMAFRIDLTRNTDLKAVAKNGLSKLVVVGLRENRKGEDEAARLEDLLLAHLLTMGLDYVPRGTPTNNTDEARAPEIVPGLAEQAWLDLAVGRTSSTPAGSFAATMRSALGLNAGSVVDRLEHAQGMDSPLAGAMNRVLWPVTLGYLLDTLLDGEKRETFTWQELDRAALWFVDQVRAGGPLPTLRVGRQPYGVLPTMLTDAHKSPPSKITAENQIRFYLHETVVRLRAVWEASRSLVPRLGYPKESALYKTVADPNGDGIDDSLLEVLFRQPNPVRFAARMLYRRKYLSELGLMDGYNLLVDGALKEALKTRGLESLVSGTTMAALKSDEDQRAHFKSVSARIRTELDKIGSELKKSQTSALKSAKTALEGALNSTIPAIEQILEAHEERLELLRTIQLDGVSGKVGDDEPMLLYSLYAESAREVKAPLVTIDSPGVASTSEWLSWLAERCTPERANELRSARPSGFDALKSPPLLYQLVRQAILHLAEDQPGPDISDYSRNCRLNLHKNALEKLAACDDVTLELLLGETLGLAGYRLDAWITSLATERLGRLRETTSLGLGVGAYGAVVELRPDTARNDSQGFVLAPSLQHATTAAVLRSGWLAHGDENDASAFAVNLSSGRVRAAQWLIEGVRQGRSPGSLLGHYLERRLHDASAGGKNLDRFIDELRKASRTGMSKHAPDAAALQGTADGLVLLEMLESGDLEDCLTREAYAATEPYLAEAAGLLDALSDTTLAEGVHQLLMGNALRSQAALDALSDGENAPPLLEVVRTPTRGTLITHRLLVMLPATAGTWPGASGAAASPVANALPGLEAWVGQVLGDPARISAVATGLDGAGRQLFRVTISAADLNISALELLLLADTGPEGRAPALEARITRLAVRRYGRAVPAGGIVQVDPDTPAAMGIALSEALLVAQALRNLLSLARAADAPDLAAPEADVCSSVQTAPLATRALELSKALTVRRNALDALVSPGSPERRVVKAEQLSAVTEALEALAALGMPDAVSPAGESLETMAERSENVLVLAGQRLAAAEKAETPAAKLQALLGVRWPIPAPFTPAQASALDANFAKSSHRQELPLAASGWLPQVARVREGAGALDEVIALAEAVADRRIARLEVGQIPDLDERWVGNHRPGPTPGGRLSLVGWLPEGFRFSAGAVSGLVVDTWNETVPATEVEGGVAFHFDAPGSMPPQVVLLAVPEGDVALTVDQAAGIVAQTLDLAMLRAIDPERLGRVGHYLPAIFLNDGVACG